MQNHEVWNHMFRCFECFTDLNNNNYSSRRLPDAKPWPSRVRPVALMGTTQEIAVYIHRFHNLDLFQQGWYQLKIAARWEDDVHALDLGTDDVYGIWRIDDTDNSFYTQPFRIKYARQDVILSIVASFNLSLSKFEGPPTSAVLLKYDLMCAPLYENRFGLLASFDSGSAAIHEFQIPPKALIGLHSYYPVHFDVFHAVLVDTSVHISVLKTGSSVATTAGNDVIYNGEDHDGENVGGLAKAIDRVVELADITVEVDDEGIPVVPAEMVPADAVIMGHNKNDNDEDVSTEKLLILSSKHDILQLFHSFGSQILHLWNTFLKFHRANKKSILEYLRNAWGADRRAEWFIWMVYTEIDMPHHYIHSGVDESSHHPRQRRVSSLWKLGNDPAQSAALRADLHRRSITQMKVKKLQKYLGMKLALMLPKRHMAPVCSKIVVS